MPRISHVFSGVRLARRARVGSSSLRRKAQDTAQDFFNGVALFEITQGAKFVAHVWLDPEAVRPDVLALYLELRHIPAPYAMHERAAQVEPGDPAGGEPTYRLRR